MERDSALFFTQESLNDANRSALCICCFPLGNKDMMWKLTQLKHFNPFNAIVCPYDNIYIYIYIYIQ